MKKSLFASAFALTLLAAPALADGGVKVGVLNCDLSAGVGLILGGSQSASCVFQGANGPETYEGRIGQVGLDIGFTEASVMSWVVFAPGQLNRGSLQGTYVGATAEATVAVGLGANVLVGGSGESIALQPVSVGGQAGLNVAAGLAQFTLKYVP